MNADRAHSSPESCEDFEFELVEYVDGASAPGRHPAIERHLETCSRCRAFVREMVGITESLALALPRWELAPGFDARLQARVATLTRASKEVARARADHEYHRALASLRRGLEWRATLNAVAAASVGGSLVVAAASLAPRVQQAMDVAHLPPETLALGLAAAGLVAALATVLGLARRPWLDLAG